MQQDRPGSKQGCSCSSGLASRTAQERAVAETKKETRTEYTTAGPEDATVERRRPREVGDEQRPQFLFLWGWGDPGLQQLRRRRTRGQEHAPAPRRRVQQQQPSGPALRAARAAHRRVMMLPFGTPTARNQDELLAADTSPRRRLPEEEEKRLPPLGNTPSVSTSSFRERKEATASGKKQRPPRGAFFLCVAFRRPTRSSRPSSQARASRALRRRSLRATAAPPLPWLCRLGPIESIAGLGPAVAWRKKGRGRAKGEEIERGTENFREKEE
ncbi:hypothetical protein MRX96_027173 [Rhipicephalus microplus]